jgi:hypothetical protein
MLDTEKWLKRGIVMLPKTSSGFVVFHVDQLSAVDIPVPDPDPPQVQVWLKGP